MLFYECDPRVLHLGGIFAGAEVEGEIARSTLEKGRNGQEIAKRLGISPSAASQQIRRVDAQLRVLNDAV